MVAPPRLLAMLIARPFTEQYALRRAFSQPRGLNRMTLSNRRRACHADGPGQVVSGSRLIGSALPSPCRNSSIVSFVPSVNGAKTSSI